MSDEVLFQSHLDDYRGDSAARLLLAEYLAERGDYRAAGYRFMGRHGKWPFQPTSTVPEVVWLDGAYPWRRKNKPHEIPREVFRVLEPDEVDRETFQTRRDAEDALASAFATVHPTPPSHDR